MTMRNEGLVSIDYNVKSKAVELVYEPEAGYDRQEIIDYVEDMSESRTKNIMVFEGTHLIMHLTYHNGKWIDVVDEA
jgi:hypothetical protein